MTQSQPHTEVCAFCKSRRAIGVGISARGDNRWFCAECAPLAEFIKTVRLFDPYERKALDGVDDVAGAFCAGLGKTDMSEMTAEERGMLWRRVVQGFGDEVRRLLRDGEAPW
jgi:hypothetical protein